jgi:hypothetical protein
MKKKLLVALLGAGMSMGFAGSVSAGDGFEACDNELTLCLFVFNRSKPYCFGQFNSCMGK